MEQDINVRNIKNDNDEIINKWWWGHGETPPLLKQLPDNGLGGFIAEKGKEKKLIAVGYLYLTNSNIAYIDAAISNPDYKGRDRYIIGVMIINELLRKASSLGYETVETTTFREGLIKRYKKMGWEVSKDKYNVITKHLNNVR